MKKLKKRIIALMAAFQLLVNIPVIGLLNVSAADAFAYQDALIPIEAFATAIAIGSGIVASQSQAAVDGASEMLRKAVASMKAKACLDSDTEFRVIDGGKPRKPQKGDDKNKKKWFTIAAGSVATGSLIAGLKASREMMQEIYNQNGYEQTSYSQGLASADSIYTESSFAYIRAQLANDAKSLAYQWDKLSDYFTENNLNLNDYFFMVRASQVGINDDRLPYIYFNAYKKSELFSYLKLDYNKSFFHYDSGYDVNYNWYSYNGNLIGLFYNNIDLVESLNYLHGGINGGSSTGIDVSQSSSSYLSYPSVPGSSRNYAIYGYYPFTHNYYSFTNQIYNNDQTQVVNFPNWLQQSIETLNGNLNGLNLAINNLQLPQTWNDTQTNIQTGTAPSNVINQYINNWSNPEQAPDPEPDPGLNPDPNPDPEPEPEPEPGQQPAEESAVEEAGKGLFDWAMGKITLPEGFFDKLPFSIPYDIYLLLKSLFPSKSGGRMVYSVRAHSGSIGDTDPSGLTISSSFDASGISTRTYVSSSGGAGGTSNKWVENAPVINLDIHWKYHDVQGNIKSIDIVKTVDLSSIGYFAMIIYISVYVFWFFNLLHWLMGSFKG